MRNVIKLFILIIVVLAGFVSGQTAQAQTKRALIIGISDYGNPREDSAKWKNIHGANDVPLLTPLLNGQGFKVKSLVDEKATYAAITKALNNLVKDCRKGDEVYIHFSMHGQPFEDLNGDEADGWDEALIPVDAQMVYKKGVYEGQNHLLDDRLGEFTDKLRTKLGPTGKLVVVLDACHSGSSTRGGDYDYVRGTSEAFTPSEKYYKPDRTKETNNYFTVSTKRGQSPVIFVEACRSYQQNNEYYDKATKTVYGSLSFFIAKAIKDNKTIGSPEWVEAIKSGKNAAEKKMKKFKKQDIVIEKSK